jgi:hypothetical protein
VQRDFASGLVRIAAGMSIEEWQAPRGGLTEFAIRPQLD